MRQGRKKIGRINEKKKEKEKNIGNV